MISETLGYMAKQLDHHLRLVCGFEAQAVHLGAPPKSSARKGTRTEGLYLNLVQLQRESSNSNLKTPSRGASSFSAVHPSLRLNLVIMVSAHHQDYGKSLRTLSAAIAHFASQTLITRQTTDGLPSGLDQLSVEWCDMSLADMCGLWSSLGRDQAPAALYLVRGVEIENDELERADPAVPAHESD